MLNLGDIVKFNHANLYSVGEVVAIYKLEKSNVKIEGDEEYKYCVDTFGTIKTFIISEKEVEKRYVEYNNSYADLFEGVPKVKKARVDDIIEEPSIIRLMDIYKAFENGDTIVINYSEYIGNYNANGIITNIDKSDFQQPFEIDDNFYIEFDCINYVKINGKIYDDITLDLYVDEIIEYSKLGHIDILEKGNIYEEIEIKDIKEGLINTIENGIFNLDDVELRICCSAYISSKKINILFEEVEQPIQEGLQYEFDAESLKGVIKEEEIPTIRLMEVFRLFKEKVSLELVTKYGDEYEIEDIDEYDFDTPFYVRIDSDLRVYHHNDIYTDERESVDYDDIEYLIYDGKKYKITQEITKGEFNKLCNKNVCIKLNGTSYSYNVLGIINDEIHLISEATTFYLKSTKVEVCFKEVEIID